MNRIAICVPVRDQVHAGFCFDYGNMLATHSLAAAGDTLIPLMCPGTLVHSQRVTLTDQALASQATHILFLDSDMRFPADVIQRLLSHDAEIVAANCSTRRIPVFPTAARFTDAGQQPVFTDEGQTGLEPVDHVGAAVMLIKTSVFCEIPKPWFATPWVENLDRFMGEDFYFSMAAKRAGKTILIDHGLSAEVKHAGVFEFGMEHARVGRVPAEEPLVKLVN